jgi:hypothetical protein
MDPQIIERIKAISSINLAAVELFCHLSGSLSIETIAGPKGWSEKVRVRPGIMVAASGIEMRTKALRISYSPISMGSEFVFPSPYTSSDSINVLERKQIDEDLRRSYHCFTYEISKMKNRGLNLLWEACNANWDERFMSLAQVSGYEHPFLAFLTRIITEPISQEASARLNSRHTDLLEKIY